VQRTEICLHGKLARARPGNVTPHALIPKRFNPFEGIRNYAYWVLSGIRLSDRITSTLYEYFLEII